MTTANQAYFLRGKSLGLRSLCKADVNGDYLVWLNDPEVNSFSGRRFKPVSEAEIERYLASQSADSQILAVCLAGSGLHIGNIKYGPIDWPNRCAEIEILIGNRSQWGKGFATEAIYLVCQHLFGTLRLHRVDAKTANPAFARAVEKLGWKKEGCLRERFLTKSGYVDYMLFSTLESEFLDQPEYLP